MSSSLTHNPKGFGNNRHSLCHAPCTLIRGIRPYEVWSRNLQNRKVIGEEAREGMEGQGEASPKLSSSSVKNMTKT